MDKGFSILDSFCDDNIKDLESSYWVDTTIEVIIKRTPFMITKVQRVIGILSIITNTISTIRQ